MNVTAVQVFAKALNITEAQLFKQLEQGQLMSAEVLPKVAQEYYKAAKAGGAYELALQGLRVTEGQVITETQRAADVIFKEGLEEGMSGFYATLTELFKENQEMLRGLGRAFEYFFKVVSLGLKVIVPVITKLTDNFEVLFGAAMVYKIGLITTALRAQTAQVVQLGYATTATAARSVLAGNLMASAWAKALLPLTAFLVTLEMIDGAMNGLEDSRAGSDMNKLSAAEMAAGFQEDKQGRKIGIRRDSNGNWYSTGKEVKSNLSIREAVAGRSRSIGGSGMYEARRYNINIDIKAQGSPEELKQMTRDTVREAVNEATSGAGANFTG